VDAVKKQPCRKGQAKAGHCAARRPGRKDHTFNKLKDTIQTGSAGAGWHLMSKI
jgi:hypothetical protein